MKEYDAYLFDWGGTVMSLEHAEAGPMHLWARVAALPSAHEALRALSLRAPCFIATNAADSGSAEILQALARAGLEGLFAGIVCSREVGARKPSAEFYSAAARAANSALAGNSAQVAGSIDTPPLGSASGPAGRPQTWFRGAGARALLSYPRERRRPGRPRILMVGDDPQLDCAGALAAGIDAVLYDPAGAHADYEGPRIASLLELLDGQSRAVAGASPGTAAAPPHGAAGSGTPATAAEVSA